MAKQNHSVKNTRVIYLATTAFLVALSIYTFIQIRNLIDSSELLNHASQVNLSLQKIATDIIDAETNQKSFLLIGDSSCITKRDAALKRLEIELHKLDALNKNFPDQHQNLALLHAAVDGKLASMRKVIRTFTPITLSLECKQNISEGIQKTKDIKEVVRIMEMNETSMLEQSTQKMSELSFLTPIFVIVLFLGALLILSVSYFKINAALREAQQLKAKSIRQGIEIEKGKEIQESEKRFHNLIFSSPSAIGILEGEDFKIAIANEPIIAIWGKGKEIIGRPYFEALPELEAKGYKDIFRKVFKTGIPFNAMETPVEMVEDGETKLKYYNFIWYPQRNVDNVIKGIGIIATEVTSQVILNTKIKESELQFRELSLLLEEKVGERTTELEQKNTDLEKLNKELQSFAYISSHDLQEPLRKIQTFASHILEKELTNLSETGRASFNKIQNAAQRMQTLIQDLLAYSRNIDIEQKYERIDLKQFIEAVSEELKEEVAEKNGVITVKASCELKIIPFQFSQLLHNLIGNALKFSIPGQPPHVVITCQIDYGHAFNNPKLISRKKYCHIMISDNGIGFDQQYSDKIFEVFQRLHSKDEYSGTGIGLSIVKKIVDNHHGMIAATGELNKGATFDIYLPTN